MSPCVGVFNELLTRRGSLEPLTIVRVFYILPHRQAEYKGQGGKPKRGPIPPPPICASSDNGQCGELIKGDATNKLAVRLCAWMEVVLRLLVNFGNHAA